MLTRFAFFALLIALPFWSKAQSPCEASLRVAEVTCSSAVVKWAFADSNTTRYEIGYGQANNMHPIQQNASNTSTLRLDAGTTYVIKLSYPCNGQTVTKSVSFRTPTCSTGGGNTTCEPLRINLENLKCNAVNLTWRGGNATGPYEVRISRTATGGNTSNVRVYSTLSSFLTVRLEPGISYQAEISYTCNGRRMTSVITFQSPQCPPDNPNPCPLPTVEGKIFDCHTIDLFWQNAGTQRAYQVVYRKDGSTISETRQVPTGATTYRLGNLSENATYIVEFSYLCPQDSQRKVTQIKVTVPACSTSGCEPLKINTERLTCYSALLMWQGANIPTTYNVQVTPNGGRPMQYTTQNTNQMLDSLAPGTLYRVLITYPCNGSLITSEYKFQTPACRQSILENVMLYPNPSSGQFALQFPQTGTVAINITDITGRIVDTRTVEAIANQDVTINTGLTPGVYFLKAVQATNQANFRIVIQ